MMETADSMPKPIRTALLSALCLLPLPSNAQAASDRAADSVKDMQQVENAWDTALTKRDQYGLENILSPQIVDIAATGDVTTRNQDVAKLFVKEALPASMKQTVIDVRSPAENLRVVNGTYVMHWVLLPGSNGTQNLDEKGVFTHVFQLVNGRWVCVNSQRTVVSEQQPQQARARSAAPGSKSNAAEPFHIPLVYKGAQSTQAAPATGNQPPTPN